MSGPHRFLSNHLNTVVAATLAVTSTRTATATASQTVTTRQGLGQVVLGGGYTGPLDATIDVNIVADVSTTPLTTSPVFTGAGNGTMTNLYPTSGAVAQDISVRLANLGTDTVAATLAFFGVTLQAAIAGTSGNLINLTAVTSGITVGAAVGSTLDAVTAGQVDFKGAQWDFGGLPLTAEGTLSSASIRLKFGTDPQIYRQYKVFVDEWVYNFSPPILRPIEAGTPVYGVTGTYTLTISNGTTTETYTSIISLYDALAAVKARSSLVTVDGVVVADYTPGGMSVTEFPLRTAAYALPVINDGSAALEGLQSIVITSTAPTEMVEITCTENATVGAETWSVVGSISGANADATTGTLYAGTNWQFLIPVVSPADTTAAGATFIAKSFSYASRAVGEKAPPICVDLMTLGRQATAKTITAVYKQRPTEECNCANTSYEGTISGTCLGIDIAGGTAMALDPNLKTRLSSLYAWRSDFIRTNTSISGTDAIIKASFYDIELADKITLIFAECLEEIYTDQVAAVNWDSYFNTMTVAMTQLSTLGTVGAYTPWAPNTTYATGSFVIPTKQRFNGHYYKQVTALMAGGYTNVVSQRIEPTWPVDGSTVSETWASADPYSHLSTSDLASWQDMGPIGSADIVTQANSSAIRDSITQLVRKYSAQMDWIRTLAGIIPKEVASSAAGGTECWRPRDSAYWWEINGAEYLPAFTNVVYHACTGKVDGSSVTCTQEFAFVIKCACESQLKEGDTITLEIIGESTGTTTYQVGDKMRLPVIKGQPVYLTGGVTGNDTYTWAVRGSTSGALADYVAVGAVGADYATSNLHFQISRGVIPFILGDQFSFSVEGGTWRWRKDGGAWSSTIPIAGPTALSDGLTATFNPGTSPSFVAGDTFSFAVVQPYSSVAVRSQSKSRWQWTGATATLTMTFASDQILHGFAIGQHSLPVGSTVTVRGYNAAAQLQWTEVLTWRTGVLCAVFSAPRTVRSLQLALASATSGAIGWIWAGQAISVSHGASKLTLTRQYKSIRGGDINPSSRYLGAGRGGSIEWDAQSSWLEQADIDLLMAMVDYCKGANDAPIMLVPAATHPEETALVRINSDDIEQEDIFNFAPTSTARRLLSMRLPFDAVLS